MRLRLMRILGASVLAVTSIAAAERNVEIAPSLGFRSGASLDSTTAGIASAEADAAPSWGLSVGWRVRPDGWLEVLFDHQTLNSRRAGGRTRTGSTSGWTTSRSEEGTSRRGRG